MEMNDKVKDTLFEIALKEYEKLKDEQTQRIGFRDNMLYVTLAAIGGVISFALSANNPHSALLLIPWICIVLGWTYLVNDEKISSIGKYLRVKLNERVRQQMGLSEQVLWGWEVAHRSDPRRVQRKVIQCIVDEIAFCLSGILSVIAYLSLDPISWPVLAFCIIEIIMLFALGIEIVIYADFKQGKA
jgi:hypothetical protein